MLDRAGALPDVAVGDEEGEAGAAAGPLETTGEPVDATRLGIFREFVN